MHTNCCATITPSICKSFRLPQLKSVPVKPQLPLPAFPGPANPAILLYGPLNLTTHMSGTISYLSFVSVILHTLAPWGSFMPFHVSELPSRYRLSDTPPTLFGGPFILWWTFGLFPPFSDCDFTLSWTRVYKCLFVSLLSMLLGVHPGVGKGRVHTGRRKMLVH